MACDLTKDPCTCGDFDNCLFQCESMYGRTHRGRCFNRCYVAFGPIGYCHSSSEVLVNEGDVVNNQDLEKEDVVVKGLRA